MTTKDDEIAELRKKLANAEAQARARLKEIERLDQEAERRMLREKGWQERVRGLEEELRRRGWPEQPAGDRELHELLWGKGVDPPKAKPPDAEELAETMEELGRAAAMASVGLDDLRRVFAGMDFGTMEPTVTTVVAEDPLARLFVVKEDTGKKVVPTAPTNEEMQRELDRLRMENDRLTANGGIDRIRKDLATVRDALKVTQGALDRERAATARQHRDLEELRLENFRLRVKNTALQGELDARGPFRIEREASELPPLPEGLDLKDLLALVHPDRHTADRAANANRLTAWLLTFRKKTTTPTR